MADARYEAALSAVRERLSAKAAAHCKRVAKSAAELARVYGVDPHAARLAGVLHDFDRERSGPELLGEARAAGIELADVDLARPHLLHARTGAIAAKRAFPELSDEVVSAISHHTLGAVGMSDLDMIVYLADMIESHRDYPGVEELREAVGVVGLRELFTMGYRQSVCHVVEAGKLLHPQSVAVWNWLMAGGDS